ncbi:hypothetical protein ZWY2020_050609 [Hordeum vulgare]|nr:hypothetical protein ZWY2020_050609 [Hordeum vulgare]
MDSRTAFCAALLLATLLPLSANASSKLYIVYMGEKKHDDPSVVMASHHDMLTSVFGSKDEALMSIVYSYKHGFSGFAAMLTKSQAEAIAKFPEVVSVKPNTFHQTHTTRSWDFLGLDHNQPAHQLGLLKKAKYGEDIIVGVIDSGIWPESRSFDDNGMDPAARWKGKCQSGQKYNATGCNRKIIGAISKLQCSHEQQRLSGPRSCGEMRHRITSIEQRHRQNCPLLCTSPGGHHTTKSSTLASSTGPSRSKAKGLIFAQYTVNLLEILTSCEGFMPCAVVDFEIAQRIASYWEMTENPVVKISPAESIVGNGVLSPIVAMFSSRGPSPAFPGILKPDVTAPAPRFWQRSATPMFSNLGHPWHAHMSLRIQNRSVWYAHPSKRSTEETSHPFDFGGGHMDPERAVDPGLVYDLDAREYNKFFNCTLELSDGCKSYNLNLNLPSITVLHLMDHVILQRISN